MQIRRNTKAFKTILEIVSTIQARPDRRDLIRLYITKAGHSIQQRISVEAIQGDVEFFYDINYQAVLNNLKSSTHQIYQSDDVPGIYFFHGTISKDWDETPFEFDARISKEFASLPELPVTREKGKTEEFVLPGPSQKTPAPVAKKEKPTPKKAVMVVSKGPEQPDYDLKHEIRFTDLERIVFRQAALSKRHVLDYYDKIADYLLPYLKDRPHFVRQQSESGPNAPRKNIGSLSKRASQELPGWVQSVSVNDEGEMFACNDKEHLLLYAELGCVEFDPCHSRKKSLTAPDYIVIGIDSSDFTRSVEVALSARDILEGLKLPCFVKTDGTSGFHMYVPLDSKSDFDVSMSVADYICKLIRLKLPNVVVLKGSDDNDYGKVVLDPLTNKEGAGVVAPYSFVAEGAAIVATPLSWDELTDSLRIDDFNYKTIFERLKKTGDPFEDLFKKKADAGAVLERLEENYSFLI